MKRYKFIGPKDLLSLVKPSRKGKIIEKVADISNWIVEAEQEVDAMNQITVTFVIDTENKMRIAPRRSEHVVCAGGEDLLSAGEITFEVDKNSIEVVHITNQSTGYCPEPESWQTVQPALDGVGLEHPGEFSISYDFRLCDNCGAKVLVKEGWFFCYECEHELSRVWNFY